MSARKPNKPWLRLGEPGTRVGNVNAKRKWNRRRTQMLKRQMNVTQLELNRVNTLQDVGGNDGTL
jgi:hypothetical protein